MQLKDCYTLCIWCTFMYVSLSSSPFQSGTIRALSDAERSTPQRQKCSCDAMRSHNLVFSHSISYPCNPLEKVWKGLIASAFWGTFWGDERELRHRLWVAEGWCHDDEFQPGSVNHTTKVQYAIFILFHTYTILIKILIHTYTSSKMSQGQTVLGCNKSYSKHIGRQAWMCRKYRLQRLHGHVQCHAPWWSLMCLEFWSLFRIEMSSVQVERKGVTWDVQATRTAPLW